MKRWFYHSLPISLSSALLKIIIVKRRHTSTSPTKHMRLRIDVTVANFKKKKGAWMITLSIIIIMMSLHHPPPPPHWLPHLRDQPLIPSSSILIQSPPRYILQKRIIILHHLYIIKLSNNQQTLFNLMSCNLKINIEISII